MQVSSLADEQAAYRLWGWTWTDADLPTARRLTTLLPRQVDVHGRTEGDDLWQNLAMYARGCGDVYLQRAEVGWAPYMIEEYPRAGVAPEDSRVDTTFNGGCHYYVEGLLDWWRHSGNEAALAAAILVGEQGLRLHTRRTRDGKFLQTWQGHARGIARQLTGACLLWRATGEERWKADAEFLTTKILTSPHWRPDWNIYAAEDTESEDLIPDAPFQLALLSDAMHLFHSIWPADQIREILVRMANFTMAHAIHKKWQHSARRIHLRSDGTVEYWAGSPVVTVIQDDVEPIINPYYTRTWIPVLVNGFRLTGDTRYLEHAKLLWLVSMRAPLGTKVLAAAVRPGYVPGVVPRFANAEAPTLYFKANGELAYVRQLFRAVLGAVDAVPGAVTALDAVEAPLRLSWSPPADRDVSHYRVLRDGVVVADSVTATHVEIVRPARRVAYTVIAVDKAGQESAPATVTVEESP